ncbi:MAG: hypothetical protein ABSD85_13780 [Acidimicrobiales bacterium]
MDQLSKDFVVWNIANCDTPRVARELRQIEREEFSIDELTPIVRWMARLAGAADGWINLVPKLTDDEERPTSLGFFALFGGGSSGVTMCTWIPGSHNHRGPVRPSLGISHVTGHRAARELYLLAIPIPQTWLVEQDHPRRGLVLRLPYDEPHERVLVWALQAAGVLSARGPIERWRADIYLPATS